MTLRPNTADASAHEALPESASLLLDVLRFSLAVLVVIGHLSLPFFSTAWPPLLSLADNAVPAFFVLSGFMIRYVTQDRERDPRRYFISRASRMYSVLLPTVVLTLVCEAVVRHLDPSPQPFFFERLSVGQTAAHTIAHLLFFTQFWGHAVLLPPNLPLWSLGYEVPYYLFFGLLCLCRGRLRWLLAAACAFLLGPQVLFLAPLWWAGCWLYDAWQWSRRTPAHRTRTALLCSASAFGIALLLWPLHGRSLFTAIAHATNPIAFLGLAPARATLLAYASGAVAWAAMLLGLAASGLVTLQSKAPWTRPIRRVAEGTFTLYLFHYPLLCVATLLHRGSFKSNADTCSVLLSVVAACVLIAIPVDRLKQQMRRQLTHWFVSPVPGARQTP